MRKACMISLIVVICVVAGGVITAVAVADDLLNKRTTEMVQQVASDLNVSSARLAVAAKSVQEFPLTGQKVTFAKIIDTVTGEVHQKAVDEIGNPVDPAAPEAEENAARLKAYGKLDKRLYDKLAKAKDDDVFAVSIWLNIPDPPLSRPLPSNQTAEVARAEMTAGLDKVKNHVASKRQGVIDELAKMGVSAHVPLYGPAVFATLTPKQIQKIAAHADVETVYGPEKYTRFMDKAASTERAEIVWLRGNLGLGISSRPVVHEDDGVSDFNPRLNNLTHPVVFWCSDGVPAPSPCTVGKNVGNHASEVAGVIASTDALFRGIAPSAQMILSANFQSFNNPGFDARAVDSFEWARSNGGNPTNMSWGTCCGGFQTFVSRYVDWAVKNLTATFVISAGNHPSDPACGCNVLVEDEKVGAPGVAWSAITVGSIFDNNNPNWAGDGVSDFSDFRNPDFDPHNDMEKPEVVAVGQDVRTTNTTGITPGGVNGTSFAAPQVAGQVTQILARRPDMNSWPEVNKAVVLASATRDIEAGRDRDGVGAVVMSQSDNTMINNRFIADCHSPGCTQLVAADFPRNHLDKINAVQGQRIRVAIAYDSWSTGGAGADQLGADLDLVVRHPNNTTTMCGSASFDNAWEVCEFTAPVTGLYDIIVNRAGTAAGWPGTFLGVAWNIVDAPNFCTAATTIPATGGSFSVNTANGGSYIDTYTGWTANQSGRERVYRITVPGTRNIAVTDNNGNIDIHIVSVTNCAVPTVTVRAQGMNAATYANAPAGTYYIVMDGFNGYVGTATMNVAVTTP